MWIFNAHGFFSVACDAYCRPEEVMVRARKIEDLHRLINFAYPEDAKATKKQIIETPMADYACRLKMSKFAFAKYQYDMAYAINYPTVKDNINPDVLKVKHDTRKKTMYRVWAAMNDFQNNVDPDRRR